MIHSHSTSDVSDSSSQRRRWSPPLPLFALQPILARIVKRIGANNRDMFGRLGPHFSAHFVIDPVNLPFVLVLHPDPDNLSLVARRRSDIPPHDAKISGRFLDLLMLVDGDLDGDALFFARALTITGNTEAVVCLRNALDDVDGSIAENIADMFGPAGRAALGALRRASRHGHSEQGNHR